MNKFILALLVAFILSVLLGYIMGKDILSEKNTYASLIAEDISAIFEKRDGLVLTDDKISFYYAVLNND